MAKKDFEKTLSEALGGKKMGKGKQPASLSEALRGNGGSAGKFSPAKGKKAPISG